MYGSFGRVGVGGYGGFGAETAPTPTSLPTQAPPSDPGTGGSSFAQLAAQYAPLLQALTTDDPHKQVAILKSRIQTVKSLPIPTGVKQPLLRELQARLEAAQRRVKLKEEEEYSVRDWRNVGKLLGTSGTILAGALAFFVITRALD